MPSSPIKLQVRVDPKKFPRLHEFFTTDPSKGRTNVIRTALEQLIACGQLTRDGLVSAVDIDRRLLAQLNELVRMLTSHLDVTSGGDTAESRQAGSEHSSDRTGASAPRARNPFSAGVREFETALEQSDAAMKPTPPTTR